MSSQYADSYQSLIDIIKHHYGSPEFIPLHAPCFDQHEKDLLNQCIDSTFVSSVGKFVDQFEHEIKTFTGAQQAVAVVNGTMGLFLGLKVVGVQPGDLVLTQSLTFVATVNAIKMHQANPVFIDVDRDTLGLNAQALETFLVNETEIRNQVCIHKATGKRIVACLPMHTLGFVAEIESIVGLCRQHHLKVVEDAAESLGSFIDGQHSGRFGDVGVFSFNGNKVLTTGGGGMLITDDVDLAQQAKHLSTTAKVPHPWLFEHDQVGYNLRMPNLNAALGVAQMSKLAGFLQEKQQLSEYYQPQIENLPGLVLFQPPVNQRPNHWLNAVLLEDEAERDVLLSMGNQQGVQMRPLWTPMHQLEIFHHELKAALPNTEWLAQRVVNIPSGVMCDG